MIIVNLVMATVLSLFTTANSLQQHTDHIEFSPHKQISRQLDSIIHNFDKNVNIGVDIYDLTSQQSLYQRNIDRYFTPASNMKSITAIAALNYLGADYTFKTSLRSTSHKILNGQLQGNLYVKFSGDPTLTSKDINILIKQLKKRKITRIKGHVYIDSSDYKNRPLGPGWMWDDAIVCFSAPVSAVNINKNCFHMAVAPAKKINQPARIVYGSNYKFVRFVNNSRTEKLSRKFCELHLDGNKKNHYTLSGCIPYKRSKLGLNIAIFNPDKYAQFLVTRALSRSKIHYTGRVSLGHNPKAKVILAQHQSKPLNTLVTEMLKESDNMIADAIFLKMGEIYYHRPTTWNNSARALKAIILEKTGVDISNDSIVDGAGLSRYDLIQPKQLEQLLILTAKNPAISSDFFNALPVAGVDGTLKHRMGNTSAKGMVFAKTGTMANITTLAGYALTKQHHLLAFSIMMNGVPGRAKHYQTLEDAICNYLTSMNSLPHMWQHLTA